MHSHHTGGSPVEQSPLWTRDPLHAARAYMASGLSVIPIRTDGSKAPACDWKSFQQRRPTVSDLNAWWYARPPRHGIGVVCGPASGNLVVLDAETAAAFDRWRAGSGVAERVGGRPG